MTATSPTRRATTPGPRRTGREISSGLAAAVALLAAVIGLPIALYAVTGIPVPHHAPSPGQLTHALTQRDTGRLFLSALLVVAWAGWAAFTASVAVEAAALARRTSAVRIPGCAPAQQLAAGLLAAVAVVLLTAPHVAPHHQAAVGPLTPAPVTLAATIDPTPPIALTADSSPTPPAATTTPASVSATGPVYVVARGDTLWAIAETHLRDPERWRQIAQLNYGRPQPDGRTLTDSHWIHPGWTLHLPADATGIATAAHLSDAPSAAAVAPDHAPPSSPPVASPPTTASPPAPAGEPDALSARPPTISPATHSASVGLASGSEIGGAFAAGVAAAVALGRLRRRHAYTPRPPGPGRCLAPAPLGSTLRRLTTAARPVQGTDGGDPAAVVDVAAGLLASDDPARREQPDLIDVGTRGDQPVALPLTEMGGISLTGPGAEDTARAWITAVLVRAGPLAAEILITAQARDRLLPDLPDTPDVIVVEQPEALLHRVEVATLGRARQLADSRDAVSYRRANPCEPLPALLAVTDTVPVEHTGRWQATLHAGSRLSIGAVLLGPSDAAATPLTIDEDRATVANPTGAAQQLAGARMFALTVGEAVDVLTALAASEQRPNSSDADPPEPDPLTHVHTGDGRSPTRAVDSLDAAGAAGASGASGELPSEPWPEPPTAEPAVQATTLPVHVVPGAGAEPAAPPPISVRLLGPYLISVDGEPVTAGLRSVAKELLAWFLLRPDGATVDAAVDALWPDTDPKQVHRQFWLATSNLRSRLRSPAHPELKVLAHAGDVYRPEADLISCDLWDFQAALRSAVAARDDDAARAALQAAVDGYQGDFTATADYLWAEPARADLHRRALDAHLRLAELEDRHHHPDTAVAVLEAAIALDGIAEEPYRRLMTVHAHLGHADAVRGTWRALQRRLADIDIDPEPATIRLYRSLIPAEPGGGARRSATRLGAGR